MSIYLSACCVRGSVNPEVASTCASSRKIASLSFKIRIPVDSTMAIEDLSSQLKDPFLLSILETSNSLRQNTSALLELIEARTSSASDDNDLRTLRTSPEVLKSQQGLAAQLAVLRGQNRRLAHLVRETKATTGNSRAEVDRLHLSLQNLYYEQRHLLGEIASCEHHAHPYARLPLIPEEAFVEKYPDWRQKREDTGEGGGEQGLMRARIAEEKKEREALEGRRLELVKGKEELVKENVKRKAELGKLDRDLETFIEVSLLIPSG